jgi:hypothetical protein
VVIWYIFPIWYVWTKKNLATLLPSHTSKHIDGGSFICSRDVRWHKTTFFVSNPNWFRTLKFRRLVFFFLSCRFLAQRFSLPIQEQDCQMVCFISIWYISVQFDIFTLMSSGIIFQNFGTPRQEQSGNPVQERTFV